MKYPITREVLSMSAGLTRRRFVTGSLAGVVLAGGGFSTRLAARELNALETVQPELHGSTFNLSIDNLPVNFTGQDRLATAINGSVPAPILRWREGDTVTLNVTNRLPVTSSIHWHGIILPTDMDGVPGLSFDGIAPGETFTYRFKLNQSGTYWYHSHSGFQEQTGMYGAMVIEPKEPDPVAYDRDYVVMLSDWSDVAPETIYANLKKMSHYYNRRERTVGDLYRDIKNKGVEATWRDRTMWNQMRMSDTDIADVTGYTYTYLMNGTTPDGNWRALFNRGERIRLRFINAAAMTIFDVRIPGLKMTVVATDGQNVEPVTVDEFRIGVAETYDVLVEPEGDSAYTLFAQSIDRSGYARGTLASDVFGEARVPAMDTAPTLGHEDMGMDMKMGHSGGGMTGHNHHGMHHGKANNTSSGIVHMPSEYGPQVDMRVEQAPSGLHDPGIGLRHHQHRLGRKVLAYGMLRNLTPTIDRREPNREIELHLTGNMSRYMWSINGVKFADAEPLLLHYGERVRFTLVNDTMMTHPVHLHGLWSELETGDADYLPRKHTILVQPGKRITYLVTADALGRWAYHCHLMYHMPGMFREVRVVESGEVAA